MGSEVPDWQKLAEGFENYTPERLEAVFQPILGAAPELVKPLIAVLEQVKVLSDSTKQRVTKGQIGQVVLDLREKYSCLEEEHVRTNVGNITIAIAREADIGDIPRTTNSLDFD